MGTASSSNPDSLHPSAIYAHGDSRLRMTAVLSMGLGASLVKMTAEVSAYVKL